MKLSIIVAFANNYVIGRGNKLPWHIPEDLQWFKRITMGKPIIMGRKTFESIGRPLPGRTNIVISNQAAFEKPGIKIAHSFDAAIDHAKNVALINGNEEAVVIGGAQIYAEALPLADRLYVTEIHADVSGDTFFPAMDWSAWKEIGRDDHPGCGHQYAYSFVVYERR